MWDAAERVLKEGRYQSKYKRQYHQFNNKWGHFDDGYHGNSNHRAPLKAAIKTFLPTNRDNLTEARKKRNRAVQVVALRTQALLNHKKNPGSDNAYRFQYNSHKMVRDQLVAVARAANKRVKVLQNKRTGNLHDHQRYLIGAQEAAAMEQAWAQLQSHLQWDVTNWLGSNSFPLKLNKDTWLQL